MNMKLTKSEKTRLNIKKVASSRFISLGYDQTTLADIANELDIDRRTTYRYYSNKQVLLLDIVTDIFKDFATYLRETTFEDCRYGFMQVSYLLDKYNEFYSSNLDKLILIGMMDSKLSSEVRSLDIYQDFITYTQVPDQLLEALMIKGIEDGSIKNDINASLTAITINNALLSLSSRMAMYAENLDVEQNIDSWVIVEEHSKLLLESIKND